jgi:hypothetical protein
LCHPKKKDIILLIVLTEEGMRQRNNDIKKGRKGMEDERTDK